MNPGRKEKILQLVKVVTVTLGVYILFKYMLPIVMPFVLAYGLCRWLYPTAVRFNEKAKIPVAFTGTVLVLLCTAVFGGILFFAGQYLFAQIQSIIKNMDVIAENIRMVFEQLCKHLGRFFNCEGSYIEEMLLKWTKKAQENMHLSLVDMLTDKGIPVVKGMLAFFIIAAIAVVGAILLIKNKKEIDMQIRRSDFSREISEITAKICQVTGCFFKSQGLIMLAVAVICSIGLFISGNKYAVLIGIFIAVMDALPVLGSGTVLIPWAVIDIFLGKYMQAAILVIVFAACAIVREFMEAKLMGRGLGINEFYMLMATFVGMSLFGIWGIILGPLGLILIIEILSQLRRL